MLVIKDNDLMLRKLQAAGVTVQKRGECWHLMRGPQYFVVADFKYLEKVDLIALGAVSAMTKQVRHPAPH